MALTRNVTVVNELGLHARSAVKLAAVAKTARGGVWVLGGAERANATSVMEVLTLACAQGSTLTLEVDDPQDAPVLEALVRLVENGFEE